MFTFILQLLDLVYLHQVGLFLVFFICSWSIYFIKILKANTNKKLITPLSASNRRTTIATKISVVIPVVDENLNVWKEVLSRVFLASEHVSAFSNVLVELIVVPNGSNAIEETKIAKQRGFKIVRVKEAGKRNALYEVSKVIDSDITVILDSDTILNSYSISDLIWIFKDAIVGGATPRHKISNRGANIWRIVSDWLEDIRFSEVLKGQNMAVSCLPGRMLAVRTSLFKECMESMIKQTFLGSKCISGDDRYLTSWLLERGYKCAYVDSAEVETEAPDTLSQFIKQRLRWSRTSLRETIRSLRWLHNYPYTAFTVLTTIIMRWFFFIIVVNFVLFLLGITKQQHYIDLPLVTVIIGSIIGFVMSGFLKQIRHLYNYPRDIIYLIPFLFITTFILTPVEWFGNLTLRESGWMTRKVDNE